VVAVVVVAVPIDRHVIDVGHRASPPLIGWEVVRSYPDIPHLCEPAKMS
jgi:hypothetical protein